MIIGIGIDIIECRRIEEVLNKFGNKFLLRIFTEKELNAIKERKSNFVETIASRFAVKESFFKALGIGMKNVSWKDVEIFNYDSGKPYLQVKGKSKDILYSRSKHPEIYVTISHIKEYGMAVVIIEDKGGM